MTTINPTVAIYPAVTVSSITSTNQDGTAAQGDTVVITFSSAIDPSSVCSTWGAGPNVTSDRTTLVTLTRNPAGHDTLSVSSGTCVFHIFSGGTLDLGQTGYVTTTGTPPRTAIFGNPPKNCSPPNDCSVVSIDATDTVLTIKLGDLSVGTVGTVASNPGITYSPDPSILGSGGASVSGTASTANRFF